MTVAESSGLPTNPYVGPVPFREGQKLYGREKETEDLVDLLVSKRIVLLIAPSGAGKTSLIQAALVPRLRERYKLLALPTIRLTYRSEELSGREEVNRYALSTMRSLEAHFPPEQRYTDAQLAGLPLGEYFARRFPAIREDGSRPHWLLILDQLEELFTLDPLDVDAKRAFLEDLGNVLAGVRADGDEAASVEPPMFWALFSMREDYVAELQPFLDLIPTGLAFRYRMDLLERGRALDPVAKPAGVAMDPAAAPRLVDGLLTIQLRTPDGREVAREGRFVEPVQLQVVCRRLWDKVVAGEKRSIRPDDVHPNDIEQALSDYVDTAVEKAARAAGVSQKKLRDWLEENLVTASGIRAQALREPLVLGNLDTALTSLVEARVLMPDKRSDREWVELAHDRLVGPLRAANRAWRGQHLKPFQRQAELYASTGQTHKEMLFWGDELIEAERFAAEHADELSEDERKFLKDSRDERDRLARARRHRLALGIVGALVLVLVVGLIVVVAGLIEGQNRILAAQAQRGSHYRNISAARETWKPPVDSIKQLLQVDEEISSPRRRELPGLEDFWTSAAGAVREFLAETDDREARGSSNLWRTFDRTLRETLKGIPRSLESKIGSSGDIVRSIAFTPAGDRLISGSWDGTASVWRVDKPGAAPYTTDDQGAETYAAALHAASNTLATTYLDGRIILWRLTEAGLERLHVLGAEASGYRKQVTTAAFDASGTRLATAGWDKKIILWDVTNPAAPTRVATFGSRYHLAPIQRIVLLSEGREGVRLASTDLDGKVAIWQVPTSGPPVREPRPERTFAVSDAHDRNVGLYSAAASPGGRYLVAGDSEGYLWIWDLESASGRGTRLTRARHGSDSGRTHVFDIAFSPDGREFTSVGVDGMMLRWTLPPGLVPADLASRIGVESVGGFGERLYSVAYHPTRRGVVATGGKRTIELVDMEQRGTLLAAPLMGSESATGKWQAVAMNPAGSTVAAARGDNVIVFWQLEGDRMAANSEWTVKADKGTRFSLDPSGSTLVTAACDAQIMAWRLVPGQAPAPATLARREASTRQCPRTNPVVSRDGKLLAVAIGSRLKLWARTNDGSWELRLDRRLDDGDAGDPGPITGLTMTAAGDLVIVAAGDSGRIRLLEVSDGRPATDFRTESAQGNSPVTSLAALPDGSGVVAGGRDGVITEWSLPALKKRASDELHQRGISGLALADRSQDAADGGSILVSTDWGGAIVEWRPGRQGMLNGAKSPIALANDRPIEAMALRADGLLLVTAGEQLLAWNFDRDVMKRSAERFLRNHDR